MLRPVRPIRRHLRPPARPTAPAQAAHLPGGLVPVPTTPPLIVPPKPPRPAGPPPPPPDVHARFAAQFNGSVQTALGSPLSVASTADLQASGSWTIGTYFRCTDAASLSTRLQPLLSKWGPSFNPSANEYILYTTNSDLKANVSVYGSGIQTNYTGTTTLAANTDYWLAATYDGAALRLYLNGVLEGSPRTVPVTPTATPLRIGASGETVGWSFTGKLTQSFKYPFVLSGAQLAWMINGGQGRSPAEVLAQSGLGAPDFLYGFESAANLGHDSSAHHNDAAPLFLIGPTATTGPGT
jgi:hypothetical protein